jgi:hypothetical protein
MIELPTERRPIQNYNPKLLVLFGKPKSGKSTLMASLDDNLIIDLEDGYRALSVMAVVAKTSQQLFEVRDALREKMGSPDNKVPYKYITIDNATRLEEMALNYAAQLYRSTPMGQGWGMLKDKKNPMLNAKDKDGKPIPDPKADVRVLPNGAGYLYLRKAVKELIEMFKPFCETLILVAHVKDKQVKVNGEEMSEMAVDLAGKLGDIICGEADAIGYIYREGNKTIISFEGGDNTIKEARPLHLRGKKFVVAESDTSNNIKVNLSEIFI